MGETKKTDNRNLDHRVALRAHFLRKYHTDGRPVRVLDCCQATGKIWLHLRKDFALDQYWGVDMVRRKGRLAVDSTRILKLRGWEANVIDIDTYGSPWKHWFRLLETAEQPAVSVFLTIGVLRICGGGCDREFLRGVGIDFKTLRLPPILGTRVGMNMLPAAIARARDFGFQIVDCLEAPSPPGQEGRAIVRYIGVHLRKVGAQVGPAEWTRTPVLAA
jgi:hypothetical protein